MPLPLPPEIYIERIRTLHRQMRDYLLRQLRYQEESIAENALAGVADVRGGDTIYAIDAHSEEVLFDFCNAWAQDAPFVLIAEGIEGAGWKVFPDDAREEDATFLMIVDPIDGTRNIMYNKRSAWILTGVAPATKGRAATLADIEVAVMTEIPTTRHLLADQLWASAGGGAHREAQNLVTGEWRTLPLRPSQAEDLAHGFASVAKFFPAAKGATAAFEERLLARVAPDDGENPLVFDDQYISTGGQLYELMIGHDRFLADLRPVFYEALELPKKLVCHPYDICVELIAREAGLIVTDERGARLTAPLDIQAPVSWVGYANARLHERIAPTLRALLEDPLGAEGKG
jgi:fructose-1,6-bisphosphatase/inositol monophosphatase family enzyme